MSDPVRVLLLDLDGTLFLYQEPLRRAQLRLAGCLAEAPPEEWLELLEFLRRHPEPFAVAGLPDPRHTWCTPQFVALLRAFRSWADRQPSGELDRLHRSLTALRGDRVVRAPTLALKRSLRGAGSEAGGSTDGASWGAALRWVGGRVEELIATGPESLARASRAFWSREPGEVEPVAGVRDLLEGLGESCRVLICTEGLERWQRAKLDWLGLEDAVQGALVSERTLGIAPVVQALDGLDRELRRDEVGRGGAHPGRAPLDRAHDGLAACLVKGDGFARAVLTSLRTDPFQARELFARPDPPPESPRAPPVQVCSAGDSGLGDVAPYRRLLGRGIHLSHLRTGRGGEPYPGSPADRSFSTFLGFSRWFLASPPWDRLPPLEGMDRIAGGLRRDLEALLHTLAIPEDPRRILERLLAG